MLPIAAYIHYPTISASMLNRVSSRETTYANDSSVTRSGWKSTAKLAYYRLFSYIYTSCLLTAPPTFLSVNSSWTGAHVASLLSTRASLVPSSLSFVVLPLALFRAVLGYNVPTPKGINQPPTASSTGTNFEKSPKGASNNLPKLIFPPCDVESMKDMGLDNRQRVIFSCAQFRPEKDHAKQIASLAILFRKHPELFIIPERDEESTTQKGESDEQVPLVQGDLDVENSTQAARCNPKDGGGKVKLILLGSARHEEDLHRVQELRDLAKELGIEAAGLIPVVHASGGPIMDIVVPVDGEPTGFHASTDEEFARELYRALTLPPGEMLRMRERARRGSQRFSTENFEDDFGELWSAVKTALH
ncbi:asparagine-linked glycosylation protein [Serendipita sp. 399]|nr:asparagine-linked glycosylation protein [Serendipita sp. 399]